MKISRREFIWLGAVALVAGVLPEVEQVTPAETCGRCGKKIAEKDAEFCWYCESYLCWDCFDEYGHCGHPEAEAQNERARQVAQTARSCPPIEIIVQRGHCSPTPAERLYAKALEAMPMEAKEKQAAFGAQIVRGHAFTSKDCEQAGQAMMDGFMSGIEVGTIQIWNRLLTDEEVTKFCKGGKVNA